MNFTPYYTTYNETMFLTELRTMTSPVHAPADTEIGTFADLTLFEALPSLPEFVCQMPMRSATRPAKTVSQISNAPPAPTSMPEDADTPQNLIPVLSPVSRSLNFDDHVDTSLETISEEEWQNVTPTPIPEGTKLEEMSPTATLQATFVFENAIERFMDPPYLAYRKSTLRQQCLLPFEDQLKGDPYTVATRIRQCNGTTDTSLYNDIIRLDKLGINVSFMEFINFAPDSKELDISHFFSQNEWTPDTTLDAMSEASLTAVYFKQVILDRQPMNHSTDEIILKSLAAVIPNLTILILASLPHGDDPDGEVSELHSLILDLLTFADSYTTEFVAHSPKDTVVTLASASLLTALSVWGLYRYNAKSVVKPPVTYLQELDKILRGLLFDFKTKSIELARWLWNKVKSVFHLPEEFESFLMTKLMGMLDLVLGALVGERARFPGVVRSLSITVLMYAALIVASIGAITYVSVRFALQPIYVLPHIPEQTGLVAEGPLDATCYAVAFISGIFALPLRHELSLKKSAEWMKNVSMLGAGAVTVFGGMAAILPYAFRHAMYKMFATEDEMRTENILEVCSLMSRLEEVSKSPDVLICPEYPVLVDSAVHQAQDIVDNAQYSKDTNVNRAFTSYLTRLMAVHRQLITVNRCTSRDLPFSIHLMGAPGVGKTHIAKYLAVKLGYNLSDIYNVPTSGDYWSGFVAQKVIIIDEFLVANSTTQHESARMYMQLIGDTQFAPNLASVDNPAVGVKGTLAAPRLVITINNHHTISVNHLPVDALKRRRNIVIEMTVMNDAKLRPDKSVDRDAYSDIDLQGFAWNAFRLHHADHMNDAGGDFIKSNVLYKEIREMHDKHFELCARIAKTHGVNTCSADMGKNILIKTLKHCDTKSSGMADALLNMLGTSTLEAQGPTHFNRKNKSANIGTSALIGPGPDDLRKLPSPPPYRPPKASDEMFNVFIGEGTVSPGPNDIVSEVPYSTPSRALPFINKAVETLTSDKTIGILRRVGQLTLFMTSVAAFGAVVRKMLGTKHDEPEHDSESSWDRGRRGKSSRQGRAERSTNWREHAEVDVHGYYDAQGGPTMVGIECRGTNLRGIGLRDKFILTYSHGILDNNGNLPPRGTVVVVTVAGFQYKSVLNETSCYAMGSNDLCFLKVDCPQMPSFRNVIKSFVKDENIENATTFRAIFGDPGECLPVNVVVRETVNYACGERTQVLHRALYYQHNTVLGDCGKLLQATESYAKNSYVGMHVAGSRSGGPKKGVATIITQEMIAYGINRLSPTVLDAQGNVLYNAFNDTPASTSMSSKTRLKKSLFYKYFGECPKQPAILHMDDIRGNGTDPADNYIKSLDDSHPWVSVDTHILNNIENELYDFVMGGLRNCQKVRKLTLKEAVAGIPTFLKSMNTSTSAGYPFNQIGTGKGKTHYMRFDDKGECLITPELENLVNDRLEAMERGEKPDHIWLGALKDELVSPEKVAVNKTRVVFSGDMVTMTALRMHFGCVLAAFNSAESDTGISIGTNPQSYDMHTMFVRLGGEESERFIAGDFRGFDKRYVETVRDSAYNILKRVFLYFDLSEAAFDYLYAYDTKSPGLLGKKEFRAYVAFFSGGLFTTIINSIVNHLYVRYAFACAHPDRKFDDCVKMLAHGDDHIINVIDPDVDFDAVVLARYVALINQEYTHDDKTEPKPGYRKFDEITFLGTQPMLHRGRYVGALKLESICQALWYTADNDMSAPELAGQMIEYASMSIKPWYKCVLTNCTNALKEAGRPFEWNPHGMSQNEIRDIVANRTAASGYCYGVLHPATGPRVPVMGDLKMIEGLIAHTAGKETFVAEGDVPAGSMTILRTDRETISSSTPTADKSSMSMAAAPNTLQYGTNSMVPRADLVWSTTDIAGDSLAAYSSPWDILALGGTDGFQNIPFDVNGYWRGSSQLTFQVNGTRFTQGLLCVYWYPLANGSNLTINNWTACEHILLSANANSTATITVPFRWPKSLLNTRHRTDAHSLGFFHVRVLSPLKADAAVSLTVSVYSSFPDSVFSLPRSRHVYAVEEKNRAAAKKAEHLDLVAQGNFQSTKTVNEYNISDVAGSIPIQTATEGAQDAKATADLQLPMDKPPLASGAIPVQNAFSGMSKALGVNPCTAMQLAPTASCRQGGSNFGTDDINLAFLMAKPSLHKVVDWDTNDAAGTVIASFCLNSYLAEYTTSIVEPVNIGAGTAIMNAFTFFRCDFELEIVCVRTPIHTGRLIATVGYGEPDVTAMNANRNSFINTVLDFTGDADRQSITIPYNHSTEFLRTYEGIAGPTWDEDQHLGFITLSVGNVLVAPDTVSSTVEVLVFLKLVNAKMAVPRPVPFWHVEEYEFLGPTQITIASTFVAEGDTPQTDTGTGAVADETGAAGSFSITAVDTKQAPSVPCKMVPGQKFEYMPTTTVEVDRRYVQTSLDARANNVLGYTDVYHNSYVAPKGLFSQFYAGYSGGINIRIYQDSAGRQRPVLFYPQNAGMDIGISTDRDYFGHLCNTETRIVIPTDGVLPEDTLLFISDIGLGTPATREVLYPISQSGWIDMNIPFQTTMNFIPSYHVLATAASVYGSDLGLICVPTTSDNETDYPDEAVYQALADDSSYGIYRVPSGIVFRHGGVRPLSTNARNVGGFWNPNWNGAP